MEIREDNCHTTILSAVLIVAEDIHCVSLTVHRTEKTYFNFDLIVIIMLFEWMMHTLPIDCTRRLLMFTAISVYVVFICWGAWRLICWFDAFCSKGRGFESRSSRLVGTLGKSFTRSCLWRFGVTLRHYISAVSGAPLSSSGLEEAL